MVGRNSNPGKDLIEAWGDWLAFGPIIRPALQLLSTSNKNLTHFGKRRLYLHFGKTLRTSLTRPY